MLSRLFIRNMFSSVPLSAIAAVVTGVAAGPFLYSRCSSFLDRLDARRYRPQVQLTSEELMRSDNTVSGTTFNPDTGSFASKCSEESYDFAKRGDLKKMVQTYNQGEKVNVVACIFAAIERGDLDMLRFLSSITCWRGAKAAQKAVESGNKRIMEWMLEAGYRFHNENVLRAAISSQQPYGAELFVKSGGKIDTEMYGTYLGWASEDAKIATLLIENRTRLISNL